MTSIYGTSMYAYQPPEDEHEVAVRANWNRMALQFIRAAIADHPLKCYMEFTTEEIADRAIEQGFPAPGHPRWWGPVIQKAQADGLIQQARIATLVGLEPLTRLTRSKHRSPVWEPAV